MGDETCTCPTCQQVVASSLRAVRSFEARHQALPAAESKTVWTLTAVLFVARELRRLPPSHRSRLARKARRLLEQLEQQDKAGVARA